MSVLDLYSKFHVRMQGCWLAQSIGFAAGPKTWLSRACPQPQPTETPLHDCIQLMCRRLCRQKLHAVLVRHVPPQRLVHTAEPYRLRTCGYLSGQKVTVTGCTLVLCIPVPSFMCVRGGGAAGWPVKCLTLWKSGLAGQVIGLTASHEPWLFPAFPGPQLPV
jgi:hypothetical protein